MADSKHSPILPGSTIGILGSGQLGRMLAIAARRLGYKIHTLSPDKHSPTGQIADKEVVAEYDDLDAITAFAKDVDVVTFEFENVSTLSTEAAEKIVPVRPSGNVLHVAQHRLREKTFLSQSGFPVAPFRVVRSSEELRSAARELGFPCILKTAGFGYDGKGQVKLSSEAECDEAFRSLNQESILEAFVTF